MLIGLAITEIMIKKGRKQENKNIKNKKIKNTKNVKRCRDGMPKVRLVHESKDQRIGKAPFLHLFLTKIRQHA